MNKIGQNSILTSPKYTLFHSKIFFATCFKPTGNPLRHRFNWKRLSARVSLCVWCSRIVSSRRCASASPTTARTWALKVASSSIKREDCIANARERCEISRRPMAGGLFIDPSAVWSQPWAPVYWQLLNYWVTIRPHKAQQMAEAANTSWLQCLRHGMDADLKLKIGASECFILSSSIQFIGIIIKLHFLFLSSVRKRAQCGGLGRDIVASSSLPSPRPKKHQPKLVPDQLLESKSSHPAQREWGASQRDSLDPCGVYSRKPPATFRCDTSGKLTFPLQSSHVFSVTH